MAVKEKLRHYIIKTFLFGRENDSFEDDDSFTDNGIIDSTGFLEVTQFIEDEFGFEVHNRELVPDNFDSLNKLFAYVVSKTQTAF